MSSGGNLTDFFDLSKKWEPVKFSNPAYRDAIPDERCAPPPLKQEEDEPLWNDDESGITTTTGIPSYAAHYRDREERIYRTSALGCPDPLPSICSGLSVLDVNTLAGSDVMSVACESRPVAGLSQYFGSGRSENRCRRLPIFREKAEIIDKINAYQVTVISGQTGCGKTTQVPQFILEEHERENKYVNILVTQPRRLAAQSVAKRVCEENDWQLGSIVGYKVGLDKTNCGPDTRLLYCTTGMFKKMVISKKSLTDWTHVILDEVHEREMDMDFVLMLCKRLLNTNSGGVKLILMSATVNVHEFTEYFSMSRPGIAVSHEIPDCRSSFKVDVFYLDKLKAHLGNQVEEWPEIDEQKDKPMLHFGCVQVALGILKQLPKLDENIHNQQKRNGGVVDSCEPGAVLVFLPGELEIGRVKSVLDAAMAKEGHNWWILPLHSRIPFQQMREVFERKEGHRKVILSTNIAESSITIPEIAYVIDFCLTKKIHTDHETNYVSLQMEWTDQQSCTQRRGRAGRVRDGRVFRLVPAQFYNTSILEEGLPEMKRAPLDKVLLDTKMLDFGSPKELLALAMCPPELHSIKRNMMLLKETGCLLPTANGVVVEDDGDLTVLGEVVASLPVDIRYGKLIVFGQLLGVLEECVIIAAGLSNKSIFATPFDKRIFAFSDKLYWADNSFSDCLAILHAYQTWVNKQKDFPSRRRHAQEEWCRSCHLQLKALEEMKKTIEEIYVGLKRVNIEPILTPNRLDRPCRVRQGIVLTSKSDYLKLKIAIFGAFYPNYFIRINPGRDPRDIVKAVNGHDPLTSIYMDVKSFPQSQRTCLPLYENQIKGFFKDKGINLDQINVDFDGNKAVIEFEPKDPNSTLMSEVEKLNATTNEEHQRPPEIDHKVYVGMKLRTLPRDSLRLKIFTDSTASRMMNRLQNIRTKSAPELTSYEVIGQKEPPAPDSQFHRVRVVHVKSPNSIWVTIGEAGDEIQDSIETLIENEGSRLLRVRNVSEIQINRLYLAVYEGCHYRARMDKVEGDKVTAFFVDYGNTETLTKLEEIIKIDRFIIGHSPCLISVPGQALECSLRNVRPNSLVSSAGTWDGPSVIAFTEELDRYKIVGTDDIFLEIYSVVSRRKNIPLVVVTIYHGSAMGRPTENFPSLNHKYLSVVNEENVKYAQFEEETYMSKADHARRVDPDINLEAMKGYQDKYFGPTGVPMELAQHMDYLLNNRTEKIVYAGVTGPFHPLEFKLSAVHRIGSFKPVNVEPDSVNSVLLDRYPTDPCDIWLAASNVGMNPSGSSLLLRATTLMPNTPGLGIVLSMIFSPYAELRCDKGLTKYTGCILGLGNREKYWNKRPNVVGRATTDKVPYYPEHDIELKFDVAIENDDIAHINKIRYIISRALSRDVRGRESLPLSRKISEFPAEIMQRDRVIKARDDLEEQFHALLHGKERNVRTKEFFHREYHWDVLPPPSRVLSVELAGAENFIFKPISMVAICLGDQDILAKLKLLIEIDKKDVSVVLSRSVNCPLCNEVFRSVSSVKGHVRVAGHIRKLEEFYRNVRR